MGSDHAHTGPCTANGKTRCVGMSMALGGTCVGRGLATAMTLDRAANKVSTLIVYRPGARGAPSISVNFCPWCGTRFAWSGVGAAKLEAEGEARG